MKKGEGIEQFIKYLNSSSICPLLNVLCSKIKIIQIVESLVDLFSFCLSSVFVLRQITVVCFFQNQRFHRHLFIHIMKRLENILSVECARLGFKFALCHTSLLLVFSLHRQHAPKKTPIAFVLRFEFFIGRFLTLLVLFLL